MQVNEALRHALAQPLAMPPGAAVATPRPAHKPLRLDPLLAVQFDEGGRGEGAARQRRPAGTCKLITEASASPASVNPLREIGHV